MRILANFGYKTNGDSYSVTFETIGDVPKDRADATVDELFSMARKAIERQVSPEAGHDEEITAVEDAAGPGHGKNGNGNGNGSASLTTGSKPRIKVPNAPASKKQKGLIRKLAREKGQFVDDIDSFTMQEASEAIDELMALSA